MEESRLWIVNLPHVLLESLYVQKSTWGELKADGKKADFSGSQTFSAIKYS